jgi:predicted cobalt transporter CbtA
MTSLALLRKRRWLKLVALVLVLTMVGACQDRVAQVGIPLAYGLTGACLALLISPTLTAALVGFVVGCVLGAAVYNNSLKLK